MAAKKTAREVIEQYKDQGREKAVAEAVKQAGCTRRRACHVWRVVTGDGEGNAQENTTDSPTVAKGRTLAEFRSLHDKDTITNNKVKAAIRQLGERWEYEADFVRRAGVSYTDLGHTREAYSGYWLMLRREGKRVWSGSKEMITQMKEYAA